MYDSTTATDIPKNATMVAGYLDGKWPTFHQLWGLFPNAIKVSIATSAFTNGADVYDVETFDLTPQQAPSVAVRERKTGRNPRFYVNRSNKDLLRKAFDAVGVARPRLWLATLDATLPWESDIDAIQWKGSNLTGGHYDESIVLPSWAGVEPVPLPGGLQTMFLRNSVTGEIALFGEAGFRHISADEWPFWSQTGAKFIDVDQATFDKVTAQVTRTGQA